MWWMQSLIHGRTITQEDYATFADRVKFIGVDLRHTPSVEKLCDALVRMLPKLDYLIHNSW